MKKMCYLLTMGLLVGSLTVPVFAASDADSASDKKWVIATDTVFKPFEYTDDDGNFVGIDVDILDAIAKDQGFEYELKSLGWDASIAACQAGQADGMIAGASITDERKDSGWLFSDGYYNATQSMTVQKDSDIKGFDDLKGKRIGMENGTTHQKYLQDKHPEVKTVAYDSYQNAIIDLKNGRIDGVFGDTAVVNEWLKTNPQLGAATPKVTDPQYFGTGLGIAVRPDNKALLEKLNAALKAIKADGTYQKISNQWFPE